MSNGKISVNRFGFAETPDMVAAGAQLDIPALVVAMENVISMVLGEEEFIDSLSDAAQADFVVPLQLAARMLREDDYMPIELVSAACTVRFCAARHLDDFPGELVDLVLRLPQ